MKLGPWKLAFRAAGPLSGPGTGERGIIAEAGQGSFRDSVFKLLPMRKALGRGDLTPAGDPAQAKETPA